MICSLGASSFSRQLNRLAHALDECLALLELDETPKQQNAMPPRRRRSQLMLKQRSHKAVSTAPGGSLHFTVLTDITPSSTVTEDDEMENGGFDGVHDEL